VPDPQEPMDQGIPSFAKPATAPPAPVPSYAAAPPPPPWSPGPQPAHDNPWAVQPPSGYVGYPTPNGGTRPLTGLAIATQVMLGIQLLTTMWFLFPVLHQRSLINRLKTDPNSVSLTEANHADDTVAALAGVVAVLFIVTGIVWIIWFYRARSNVDAWGPVFQRRSRGWAIGAWLCPVVNLWFPYMIARDILDDTERGQGGSHDVRRSRPLLMTWWLVYVALSVSSLVERANRSRKTLDDLTTYSNIEIVTIALRLVAGILAILVVRQITAAQTRRRSGAPAVF
jgi:Domain of unknown function (DUF4328)